MPQAVAVPLGAAGISALGNWFSSRSNNKPLQVTQSPDQQAAQQGITSLARMLQGQSQGVYDVGLPAYQRATGFYNQLLGSRTGQTQALAPALENTAANYQGAQNQLTATTQRGPTQDLAKANLQRDAAGANRNLYRDAPYQAAGALGQLGVQGLSQAGSSASGALQGYGSLANNANDQQRMAQLQQQYNNQQSSAFGGSLGSLFSQLLPLLMGGKSKTSGGSYGGYGSVYGDGMTK